MGCIPPPPALTPAEFKRRWDSGARTMRDLDPSLAEWADKVNIVALTAGTLVLLCMLIFFSG